MSVKSGPLEPLKLFKIFRNLLERKTSGELTLTRGQIVKKARLAGGRPTRVVSNVRRESVVGALQEQGVLDDARLQAVQRLREERGLSAERALVELNLLTAARLQAIEGQLARRRLLESFGWRDGQYTFAESAAEGEGTPEAIDTIELLLEASARVIKHEDCLAFLAAYPGQTVRLTDWNRTYGAFFDRLFGQSNVRLLLVRPMTFDDLVREIGDEQKTARQIFGLIMGGLGVFGTASASPVVAARPSPPAQVAPSTPVSVSRAAPPPVTVSRVPDSPAVSVSRVASPTVGATGPAARTVGMHAEVSVATPVPDTGPLPPPVVRQRGQPVARAAEVTVATPVPDLQVRPRPVAAAPRPTTPPQIEAKPARPATPPAEVPERQRKILADIDVLFRGLQTKNHYELLGVDPKTDAERIRARFRQLARDFHVDRFARYGLTEEVMKRIQKVFMAINRAHEVLVDPAQRKEYDLGLEMAARGQAVAPGGGFDAAGVFKSEQLVRDGTLAIKNGNPKLAKAKFEQALEKNADDPVARAGVAYADLLITQGQGGSLTFAAKTRDIIEKLVSPDLSREEPFLYLGRVYRILGDADKAMRAFEKAIEINKHCAEAASELRHLQRKSEDAAAAKKSPGLGLFGKKK